MALNRKKVSKILSKYGIYIAFLIIFVLLAIASPAFLTAKNLINIIRQISVVGIISVGMTYVIISGGIDLSVGAVAALAGVITANYMREGEAFPLPIAVGIGLLVGLASGAFSGFFITKLKVPPFIATLASTTIAKGITYVYTNGRPITGLAENFKNLGNGYLGFIPIPVAIYIAVMIVGAFFLHFTRYGRYIFAVGGNEKSAEVSGINTSMVKFSCYAISGFCAALAGIVLAARIQTGQPASGVGFEQDAITAVVIGGGSLSGGVGSVIGTLVGMLILGVMTNGLDLLNVSSYYQQIIKGAIILVAVVSDMKRNADEKSV